MAAQNAQARSMESVRPDRACGLLVAERQLQSLAQFTRRLVGEGDGDDLPRLCRADSAEMLGTGAVFRLRVVKVLRQKYQIVLGRPLGRVFVQPSLTEAQEVDDAVDQHSGLAAACTRQNEQRAVRLKDCLALLIVQFSKAFFDDCPSNGRILHIKFGWFHICPRFILKIYRSCTVPVCVRKRSALTVYHRNAEYGTIVLFLLTKLFFLSLSAHTVNSVAIYLRSQHGGVYTHRSICRPLTKYRGGAGFVSRGSTSMMLSLIFMRCGRMDLM